MKISSIKFVQKFSEAWQRLKLIIKDRFLYVETSTEVTETRFLHKMERREDPALDLIQSKGSRKKKEAKVSSKKLKAFPLQNAGGSK